MFRCFALTVQWEKHNEGKSTQAESKIKGLKLSLHLKTLKNKFLVHLKAFFFLGKREKVLELIMCVASAGRHNMASTNNAFFVCQQCKNKSLGGRLFLV